MGRVLCGSIHFIVICTVLLLSEGQRFLYFVQSESGEPCPGPCHRLSYYLQRYTFESYTTLHFMSGEHRMFLNGTNSVIVSEAEYIALIGSTHVESQTIASPSGNFTVLQPSTRIVCTDGWPVALAFVNVYHLRISNISFINCGARLERYLIDDNIVYDIPPLFPGSALFFIRVSDLRLDGVLVQNSTGYGVIGINNLIDVYIHRCAFLYNHNDDLYSGGNGLFIFANTRTWDSLSECFTIVTRSVRLRIVDTFFMFGSSLDYPLPLDRHDQLVDLYSLISSGCAGLTLMICPTFYSVEILLANVVVANNYASLNCEGNNLWIAIYKDVNVNNPIKIESLVSFQDGIVFESSRQKSIGYTSGIFDSERTFNMRCRGTRGYSTRSPMVYFKESKFIHSLLALNVVVFLSRDLTSRQLSSETTVVYMHKCFFSDNFAHLDVVNDVSEQSFLLYLNQTTFSFSRSSGITLKSVRSAHIVDCLFVNNHGTAITAVNSDLHFRRNVSFQTNTGYNGGALALLANSFLHLRPNTDTFFTGNHAVRSGGAIYVNNKEELVLLGGDQSCFFQVHHADTDEVSVVMEKNTAGVSGSAIYGGLMGDCKGTDQYTTIGIDLFKKIFVIANDSGRSVLASDPAFVHFCENGGVLQDLNGTLPKVAEIRTYPGKNFNIELGATGRAGGLVPAAIIGTLNNTSATLGALQGVQDVNNVCKNLTYTVFTKQKFVQMEVRVGDYAYFHQKKDSFVRVNVFLENCPVGFELSLVTHSCDCSMELNNFNISCDINDQTFARRGSLWLHGYPLHNETLTSVVVHQHCPLDYCNPFLVSVNLDNPDTQCSAGRRGVLCGSCIHGLGLTTGRSSCTKCSNRYLALFILFALLGLVLIAFLTALNFTVSVGTINGLIFFANVVQSNHALFFPSVKSSSFLTVVSNGLSLFIAWLNLDFGISVCLHQRMNAYILAWLQFMFPIYVWIIVSGMVFFSNRYTLAVKLLGNNAVSVLATLLLLSYAKLLRTIIKIFSFTVLHSLAGDTAFVWLIDGNITFLQGKHIPLFVVALGFVLLFILPYTLILVLIPCLQARSGCWYLKWVNSILPILDAYQGPYKKKFRYWTGLMLIVRIFLFVSFAVNSEGDPRINLLVIVTTVICLLTSIGYTGTVYKLSFANVLESFFLFSLGVVSSWSLLARQDSSNHSQTIISTVIVGLAFVVFLFVVVYHILLKLKKKLGKHTWFKRLGVWCCKTNNNSIGHVEDHERIPPRKPAPPTVSVVKLSELREALLTDS